MKIYRNQIISARSETLESSEPANKKAKRDLSPILEQAFTHICEKMSQSQSLPLIDKKWEKGKKFFLEFAPSSDFVTKLDTQYAEKRAAFIRSTLDEIKNCEPGSEAKRDGLIASLVSTSYSLADINQSLNRRFVGISDGDKVTYIDSEKISSTIDAPLYDMLKDSVGKLIELEAKWGQALRLAESPLPQTMETADFIEYLRLVQSIGFAEGISHCEEMILEMIKNPSVKKIQQAPDPTVLAENERRFALISGSIFVDSSALFNLERKKKEIKDFYLNYCWLTPDLLELLDEIYLPRLSQAQLVPKDFKYFHLSLKQIKEEPILKPLVALFELRKVFKWDISYQIGFESFHENELEFVKQSKTLKTVQLIIPDLVPQCGGSIKKSAETCNRVIAELENSKAQVNLEITVLSSKETEEYSLLKLAELRSLHINEAYERLKPLPDILDALTRSNHPPERPSSPLIESLVIKGKAWYQQEIPWSLPQNALTRLAILPQLRELTLRHMQNSLFTLEPAVLSSVESADIYSFYQERMNGQFYAETLPNVKRLSLGFSEKIEKEQLSTILSLPQLEEAKFQLVATILNNGRPIQTTETPQISLSEAVIGKELKSITVVPSVQYCSQGRINQGHIMEAKQFLDANSHTEETIEDMTARRPREMKVVFQHMAIAANDPSTIEEMLPKKYPITNRKVFFEELEKTKATHWTLEMKENSARAFCDTPLKP